MAPLPTLGLNSVARQVQHFRGGAGAAWSPVTGALATGSDRDILLYGAGGRLESTVPVGATVSSLAWSPSGEHLAASTEMGQLLLVGAGGCGPVVPEGQRRNPCAESEPSQES